MFIDLVTNHSKAYTLGGPECLWDDIFALMHVCNDVGIVIPLEFLLSKAFRNIFSCKIHICVYPLQVEHALNHGFEN